MLAALAGNLPLIEELLARGANPDAVDEAGMTAVMHAVIHAALDATYRQGPFAGVFDRLAPSHLDVQLEGRQHRLVREQGEYHILLRMLSRFRGLRFAESGNISPDAYPELGLNSNGEIEGFTAHTLAWPDLPADAPSDLLQGATELASLLTQNDALESGHSLELWVQMPGGTFMPNPDLFLPVTTPTGTWHWQPLIQAMALRYAHLPEAFRDEVRPFQVRSFAPVRPLGTTLPRLSPETWAAAHSPRDPGVTVPAEVGTRYDGAHDHTLLSVLLGSASGVTAAALHAQWPESTTPVTLARTLRRLRAIRLVVPDDEGRVHALMDTGDEVLAAGDLQHLSDDALHALLIWQSWRGPEGIAPEALQELRASGFKGVVRELLLGESLPDHLRAGSTPTFERRVNRQDRAAIRAAVLDTLREARTAQEEGDPVVVDFGQAFFQFVLGDDPAWLVGEVAGPETRGETFEVTGAYQARLAASGWLPEAERDALNHAQAWNLSEVSLEAIVDETMALAFDLYGAPEQDVKILVVR
ncbi:ankyrin repeat domain-containing protein [Deinococcus multiflagellatus]|uniref:Ankyrin repeat domain-containing protein n=2 Tax=Deinococcus multiflagellatus TaxID=1656887 RepID=A0ABW1ZSR5_9DEIO